MKPRPPRNFRERMRNRIARLLARVLKAVPRNVAVRALEQTSLEGRLDFGGQDIYLSVASQQEVRRLKSCQKEPETVVWLQTHMRPDSVLYDVGANVGAYSLVANALAKGQCQVYAFEPVFSNFSALCRNILRNNCSQSILAVPIALSDHTGQLAIEYSSIAPGAAEHRNINDLSNAATQDAAIPAQRLLCSSLDDMVKTFKLQLPNLMKVDVDGPELAVISGAAGVLSHPGLSSVLIEMDRDQTDEQQVISLMERQGFSLCSRHPRARSAVQNFIFTRSEADKTS